MASSRVQTVTRSMTAPTGQDGHAEAVRSVPLRAGLVRIFPRDVDAVPSAWVVRTACVVGRSRKVEIHLDDDKVSRQHARIEPQGGAFEITDLESRHGTFVDGRPVGSETVRVDIGSIVRIGQTLLLAVRDVSPYEALPRRFLGAALGLPNQVTAGPTLAATWDHATQVARLGLSVLLLGESGTGKEIVARILHVSSRRKGAFVGLNVAAVPESLFESELFGHERGAFTGAVAVRAGAFREAAGGTLFLDEVGDLRLDLQAKLLRALDLQRVRPVGASADVSVDARVVAATSKDLQAATAAGTFRGDLYYRLAGVVIHVPPLRSRRDDVLLLALSLLAHEGPTLSLSSEAAEKLALCSWEGNVRQLRHAVQHAIACATADRTESILPRHLPELPVQTEQTSLSEATLRSAMARCGGNASQAAKLLGVSRTTLYSACKRLGLDPSSLR